MNLEQILFHFTKSFGIAYVTTLQFIYAIGTNMLFDKYLFKEQMHNYSFLFEFCYLCIILGMLSIFSYVGRKLIQIIPSPFHLINGFDHTRLKELTDTGLITGFMLLTSGIIAQRISNLKKLYHINI